MPESRPSGLRVVVLGDPHADSFAENITDTFTHLGAQTFPIDPRGLLAVDTVAGRMGSLAPHLLRAARSVQPLHRAVHFPVARALRQCEPHLVLSTDGYIPAEVLEYWRAQTPGAVWALWYPDSLANLGSQLALDAPWDHLFFKDPYLVELLRSRTRLPAHFVPQACNPRRHRPEPFANSEERARYECDVALAGNIYPYRVRVLETIPEQVDLRLYGKMPVSVRNERIRGAFRNEYVTGRAKVLAYLGAKIVLNTMHYAEIRSLNARLFEATACGGFVITHTSPGLSDFYRPDEEVVAVDSAADMGAAISQYLGDEESRSRIARAGQARAHREHTYERRLEQILETCHLTL